MVALLTSVGEGDVHSKVARPSGCLGNAKLNGVILVKR